jgi:hypothetical protein
MESALIAALIVGGCVLLALVGLWLVRTRIPVSSLEPHHEVAGFFIGVLGAIYAVLLAFVVIVMWEKFEDAHTVVASEANDIGDLARLAESLPEGSQGPVREALLAYTQAVITDEWPAMSRGEDSQRTWAQMRRLWAVYRTMDPQSFVERTAYETSLDRLSELTDSRRMRLGAAREHVPGILWILLWGGGVVTVLFTYFFGVRNVRSQMLMTGALSLLIAFVLFLIVALNHPFAGVTRVGAEPLEDELARLQRAAYE